MGRLVALALVLVTACGAPSGSGQLGLPSQRPSSPAASAPPTPSRSASPSPSAGVSASPSASPATSASASPSPTASLPATTPSPTASADQRPGVVAAVGTQVSLTVIYSGPMRAAVGCGGSAPPPATGDIDDPTAYVTADRVLEESLRSSTRATVSPDCTRVTFVFGTATAAGTSSVTPTGVQDAAGRPIDPARASARVTIEDAGRPEIVGLETSANTLTVAYSEPMLEFGEGGGVRLAGNYRIDGGAIVAMTIVCLDAGCRTVRVTLLPGALIAGRSYTLSVANVVDRAGRTIAPDPTTRTFTGRA